MIKNLFILVVVALPGFINAQSFWKRTDESKIVARSGEVRTIIPEKYHTFSLDIQGLKNYLASAPMETDANRKSKELILDIPMADGNIEKFKVYESPVMGSIISAKYPSIKSYKAYHITDKSKNLRFDITPNGFHAGINALDGEKYIDPYSSFNTDDYIVYHVKDHKSDAYKGVELCGYDSEERPAQNHFKPLKRFAGEVELRTYRVAMACTGEWGKKRGTVAKCLADINTMMNRMNLIYEKEMAMRFVLIDDNDKIIHLDPATDPYDNSDEGKKIVGLNTGKLNQFIPANSYDIGHVLSVCFDIGGVAQGGSACQSNKGNGVTCNNDNDLSGIVTRVMAHEVGHQLDASHTWNICTSAADQRAPNTAFEPGSGTTIMSYAGTCGSDNVANDNDDYFHVGSLDQMYAKTTDGGNAYTCATKTGTGNHYPTVTMPSKSYVIPIVTPFELSATAVDEDNDAMTYTWEQYDTGELVSLGTPAASGPLFRSIKPGTDNTRFFPTKSNIFNGVYNEKTEVLPTVSRSLKFKFTVRDNNAAGAGVVSEEYTISSTSAAGPFRMIFPLLDNKFEVGQQITVTWNVANTDKAPVNCQLVNIYASISSALKNSDSNLIPLALGVPNDGSQEVYIPNRISNFVKIVIKAADNIFLTTSTLNSKIVEPTSPTVFFDAPSYVKACQPENTLIDIKTYGFGGLTGNVDLSILSGLPSGVIPTFASSSVPAGGSTVLTLDTKNLVGTQVADFVIRAIVAGVDTIDRKVTLSIVGGDISNLNTLSPANGLSGVPALPKYNWVKKVDATSYNIQVSTSPDFLPANLITNQTLTDSTFTSNVILDKAKVYYWRVRGKNECGDGAWSSVKAFVTEALTCTEYKSGAQSIAISGVGSPKVELPLTIPNDGTANDINVKLVKVEHARPSDLVVFLVSPSGKESLLWSKKCGGTSNVSVGVDDQSPLFFQCPINTNKVYRPEALLSSLNGEATKGTWKLRVEDQVSGTGGKLTEFNLEICSNVTLDQPFLVKNETLNIYPGNKSFITDALLLVQDNNNTADQLRYTLVTAPSEGKLTYNGVEIAAGARFTQAELNSSKVRYEATASGDGTDSFSFVVEDGQGGWISITKFNIVRDDNFVNAANDIDLSTDVFVQPNPTTNDINVVLTGQAIGFTNYFISDVAGRNTISGKLTTDRTTISLEELGSGVYFLKLSNGKQIITKKVVKI